MNEAYQPLHHKYRPRRLSELVGQEAIAATLANALASRRIAPAYLFSGPRGTGKTSSARILARSLNCLTSDGPTADPCGRCDLCITIAAGTALDVIEIDAASNTGVDNIRELIERSRFAPVQARWKVYVVDECHMLSTAAFNALLKTLEEPPPQVVFVLATTDPQRVLPTILSRCQRFDFRRIPLNTLEEHLRWIAEQEKISISAEALHVVAQRAQGGLRDAESLLDQLSLLPPPIEPAAVWDLLGAVPEEELLTLVTALADGEPLAVVESSRLLLERGREPNAVLQGVAGLMRDLLLAGEAPERLELTSVSRNLWNQLPPLAGRIGRMRLLQWHSSLKGSEQQLRHSVQPRLWLEVLLLGLLAEPALLAGSQDAGVPSGEPTSRRAPGQTPQALPAQDAPRGASPIPAGSGEAVVQTPTAASEAQGERTKESATSLADLWQQILAALQLPSTRMLLSQQAHLRQLDEKRAVVSVASNWITMVQGRLPLLEKAIEATLGAPRLITLEAGDQVRAMAESPSAPPDLAPEGHEEAAQTQRADNEQAPGSASSAVRGGEQETMDPPSPSPSPCPSPARSAEEPALPAGSPPSGPSERLLEESTGSLAEFFNGQVIANDP